MPVRRPRLRGFPVLERRAFLQRGLTAMGGLALGCGSDPTAVALGGSAGAGGQDAGADALDGGSPPCADPVAAGARLSIVPFLDEGEIPFETLLGEGWDGRLYTDLSKLDADALIVDNDRFYVRTRYPDLLDPNLPWSIRVHGLVQAERQLSLDDLRPLSVPRGAHVLECSGNSRGGHFGLLSAAEWGGVALTQVLSMVNAKSSATGVLVSGFDEHSVPSVGGHSKPGASWVFRFDQLQASGAFLALEMNGAPLPAEHGKPVRLFVPGWYGCTCIKWVNDIRFVDDSEPSTPQMQEFASRTHQVGVPALAKDFQPANIQQAAMPVRVEKWKLGQEIVYRVVGILWGGAEPTDALEMRFGSLGFAAVDVCPAQTQNQTWTLWSHVVRPTAPGVHDVDLRIADPAIPQRRLDAQYYRRSVAIDEV